MKQEKVRALQDNDARIAALIGAYEVQAKPHGHGDVHVLYTNLGRREEVALAR